MCSILAVIAMSARDHDLGFEIGLFLRQTLQEFKFRIHPIVRRMTEINNNAD